MDDLPNSELTMMDQLCKSINNLDQGAIINVKGYSRVEIKLSNGRKFIIAVVMVEEGFI